MSQILATVFYVLGICWLFALDRNPSARTSVALCIPLSWMLINGSRPVSAWLQSGPLIDTPEKYLDGSPLDAFVWGILLVAGLIVLVRRHKQVGILLRANVPVLLFFFYCALSIFWSDYSFVALKRWTKAIGDVVMVLIVLTDPDRINAIKRLLAGLGFVLIPLSILFIKYYPNLGRSYIAWSWIPMYSGVTLGKNLLGMTCLIAGLGGTWRFLYAYRSRGSKNRSRHLIAHGALVAMVIWLLWMANSMTSISCLGLAGGLMVMTSLPLLSRKPAVVHFLAALVVSLSLCALFLPSSGLVESLGRDPTLTGRTEIWKVVVPLAGNPLFGTGFESFWLGERLQKVWDQTEKGIQEAHNGYLEVYLNLGWIGIALLAVIIVTGYRNIVAALPHDRDGECTLWLGYLIVGVVYNLTEAGFRMMSLVWIAFLLAVMASPKSGSWKKVGGRFTSKSANAGDAHGALEPSSLEVKEGESLAGNFVR